VKKEDQVPKQEIDVSENASKCERYRETRIIEGSYCPLAKVPAHSAFGKNADNKVESQKAYSVQLSKLHIENHWEAVNPHRSTPKTKKFSLE
jgi:hypothetical protein